MRVKVSRTTWILQKWTVNTCFLTTLIILPNLGTDPINVVKLVTVFSGLILSLVLFFSEYLKALKHLSKILMISISTLFLFFILSFMLSNQPLTEKLLGTWGRSTGLVYYSVLLILIIVGNFLGKTLGAGFAIRSFILLSIPFNLYGFLQAFGIDPIPWSRKEVFSTVGNTNFSSALCSFFGIAILSKYVFSETYQKSSEKLGLISMFALNFFVLIKTSSVQGFLLLTLGGLILVLIKLWIQEKKRLYFTVIFSILSIAPVVFAGLLDRGPLSKLLFQETLAYRTDYWRAGLNMIADKPFVGLGFDAYGDYYRLYRDSTAVFRTGPERVSNTAHNIFIDLGVNAGFIVMLLMLVLFIYPSLSIIRRIFISKNTTFEEVFLSVFLIAYFVQGMISINQIGIGVWAWLFMGLAFAVVSNRGEVAMYNTSVVHKNNLSSKKKASRANMYSTKYPQLSAKQLVSAFITIALISPIALAPIIQDFRVLKISKSIVNESPREDSLLKINGLMNTGQAELILDTLAKNQDTRTLDFAKELYVFNPRSLYALRVISEQSPDSAFRNAAKKEIINLDPLGSKS